jgi:predicted transcriptional regulator
MSMTRPMLESLGVAELIVTALKKYGTLPDSFLSRLLGRERQEIEKYLRSLEQKGLIRRNGPNVSLTTHSR